MIADLDCDEQAATTPADLDCDEQAATTPSDSDLDSDQWSLSTSEKDHYRVWHISPRLTLEIVRSRTASSARFQTACGNDDRLIIVDLRYFS